MAVDKDRIVVGDTYRVAFQAVKRSSDQRAVVKAPVVPDAAYVTLWDVIAGAGVPLGLNGAMEAEATITENRIEYLIPASKFEADGDYKVYVTAVFTTPEGTETITNLQSVRVIARQ